MFLIFPYSWREAPFRRYSGETNRITSPLNVLRDHCWDSLLATDEIETSSSRGTDSFETCFLVLLSIWEGKFFWNDKCIERKDGSVSIPIMKITWRVYGRSVARETEREIRSEASRWTHWKRIYLRGKLMVERRSDEWICLFSFFLLQISLH